MNLNLFIHVFNIFSDKEFLASGFSLSICCICNIGMQAINFYFLGQYSDPIVYSAVGLGQLLIVFLATGI